MSKLSTPELIQASNAENQQYRRGQPMEGTHSLELFRRAVGEQDQQAWEAIYARYWRLMAHWVNGPLDQVQDRVQTAYLKFLHAIQPQSFAGKFATIGHLMAFLKRCAYAVRIDANRARARQEIYGPPGSWDEIPESHTLPSDEPELERIARKELLAYVEAQMRDDQERIVLHLTLLGCTPRQVAEKAPALFPTPAEVYKVKERVLLRLSSDPRLREWQQASIPQ